MTTKIYTAYHKLAALVESEAITPIHAGRAKANTLLPDMIGDDTGENISALNDRYCELTALYWAWKNDRTSDRIGLMHYRRLFDFDGQYPSADAEVFMADLELDTYTANAEAWLDANPEIDLVLPQPHTMHITVRENFEAEHLADDLRAVEDIITKDHADFLPYFRQVCDGHDLWLGNMFVVRREIFENYCAWLFDVLAALDTAHDRPWVSNYNTRYLGFMAERLLQVWFTKFLTDNPNAAVHRCNILNLSHALTCPAFSGSVFNDPRDVNVAFSSDEAYLPHTAAMLRSMADNVNSARRYNLFFLHEAIPERVLELLETVLRDAPNVSLYPLNVGRPFEQSYRDLTHAPSNATFNRFLLFQLLPDLDRLLYMDVDMILRGDVAEIFDTKMDGYQIAAVPDYIMTRVLTRKVATKDPAVPDLGAYLREGVGLTDDEISRYFNAGLMVMNFREMDLSKVSQDLLDRVAQTTLFFRDQDILNAYFKDSYLPIDARYNVFNSALAEYDHVPVELRIIALEARQEPFLIHFAAWQHKPWNHPETHFSNIYWDYLRRTPFYATVLAKTLRNIGEAENPPLSRKLSRSIIKLGVILANHVPALRPVLLRGYHETRKIKFSAQTWLSRRSNAYSPGAKKLRSSKNTRRSSK